MPNSPQFSDMNPGDIVYCQSEETFRLFSADENLYTSLDAMSRVQLKILGVHLSELQVEISRRLAERARATLDWAHSPANLNADAFPEGIPDGPA